MPLYLGLNSNLDSSQISLINTLLKVQVPLELKPEAFKGGGDPPISVVVEVITGTRALLAAVTELFNDERLVADDEEEFERFAKLVFEEIADISFVEFFLFSLK